MNNYFSNLNFRNKIKNLKKSYLIGYEEFINGVKYLKDKKIVIIGAGSQGLNQGLNMRDSGLNIKYALYKESIIQKKDSWRKVKENNFYVGTYEDVIPEADLVINLTPDRQHSIILQTIQLLMKKNSILGYSHGFNIIEMNEKIRDDITVIMVAPKSPGTEVRSEYLHKRGVPALIAVHDENNLKNEGLEAAKAWAYSIGSHRAGVIESSFSAEVKSDLMGEQTVLCGMLQTASLIFFDWMVKNKISLNYAVCLLQYGWKIITATLKIGGITLMMDRLSNIAKLRVFYLSNILKTWMRPLFETHMDNILSGVFSKNMICDWNNKNKNLLLWRDKISNSIFEKTRCTYSNQILEQTYFDHGRLMVAILKAGIELAFEIMVSSGISEEVAYYESLHELNLIANIIACFRLKGMNLVISDTAEYGSYLFTLSAIEMFEKNIDNILEKGDLGETKLEINAKINNIELYNINNIIKTHPIEIVGVKLRNYVKKQVMLSNNNIF